MLNTAAKLKAFFAGFGLPAYTLASVPEEVELPYISYRLIEPEWDKQADTYCQVFYPKNRLEALLTKADQIAAAIGTGHQIKMPGGYIVLYPAENFIQIMSDAHTQSAYISLIIKAYHKPGD